jgi:arylamine N-acetyltransferase
MHLQETREYPALPAGLVTRYLRILGVTRSGPSLAALCELVAAHVERVPYENVSTLYYRAHGDQTRHPGPERFLDGVERHQFGGTCGCVNVYFRGLLSGLGYDADLCWTDGHVVVIVTIEGREFLVDVGHGAPFFDPLPLDLTGDYAVALGRDRFLLKPRDAAGRSPVEFYRGGRLEHAYLVDHERRSLVVLDAVAPAPPALDDIAFVRYLPGPRSLAIRNGTLVESVGTFSRVTPLDGRDGLADTLERVFSIPHAIVEEALGAFA